jgi:hypothetical protein
MEILSILHMAVAAATVATGLLALIKPTAAYGFTGLKAEGARGISEIRSIFGGLFVALGVTPFFLGLPAYRMLGYAYLAIAIARLFSIIMDKSYDRSNWISLVIEFVFGVILIF